MAFKMKGNPMDFIRSQKLKANKTLSGEYPNTSTDQRDGDFSAINDLEDRIGFIENNDIGDDGPTQNQKTTLRALKARLKKLRT